MIESIELSVKRFDCKMTEDALHWDFHVTVSCSVAKRLKQRMEFNLGIFALSRVLDNVNEIRC